jgi:hypothetical protein
MPIDHSLLAVFAFAAVQINSVLVMVVIRLLVVGILLGLINSYVPMASSIKQLLNAVVVIYMVIWVLQVFGILGPLGTIRLP